jgi:Mg/Co/Ni transporter MgtE
MSAPEELLERIRLRLDESFVGIGDAVADLPAADLADLVNQLTLQEAASVISMLPIARAVEVFDQALLERRSVILEKIEPGRAGQILEKLSADERAYVVRAMGERERRRLLPKLSDAVRAEVERLLQYPARSAGGIMTTEFVRLAPTMKVGEALKHLQSAYSAKPDPEIAAHLGEVLWSNGKHDEAQKIWRAALTENPNHETLLAVMQKHRP